VGEDDVVVLALRLALKGLHGLGAVGPPAQARVVVAVVHLAGVPDPAAGGAGLVLGVDQLLVEAAGVAVLHEVGAHTSAHALDVVVEALPVLLDEDVGEEAAEAVAHLFGVVALELDVADALKKRLGEGLGVLPEGGWGS
jgi:hypothetical protein